MALASLASVAACAGQVVALRRGLAAAVTAGDVPKPVVTIGRLYLEQSPADADPQALRRVLGISDDQEPDAAWVARVNAIILAEIDAGNFVDLAGWQLAPTECRIYALAALAA